MLLEMLLLEQSHPSRTAGPGTHRCATFQKRPAGGQLFCALSERKHNGSEPSNGFDHQTRQSAITALDGRTGLAGQPLPRPHYRACQWGPLLQNPKASAAALRKPSWRWPVVWRWTSGASPLAEARPSNWALSKKQ